VKWLITGDWHIGNLNDSWILKDGQESKIVEVFKQINRIVDYALKNKIKHLFILGDMFDKKIPLPKYTRMVIEILNLLDEQEIETYIILGNHEASNSNESALASLIKIKYKNIYVIENIDYVDIENKRIIFVPHIVRSKVLKYFKDSKEEDNLDKLTKMYMIDIINKIIDDKKENIIMGHLHFKGAKVGAEEMMIHGGVNFFPEIDKKRISRIFLGHIHKFQILKWGNVEVAYTGSIVRCNFSERGEEKGFIVYDTKKDDFQFSILNTTKYKQININLVDKDYVDLDENKIRNSVLGKIVKISINISEENRKKLNLIEIREVFSKFCYVSKIEINVEKKNKKNNNFSNFNINDIFKDYISKIDNKNINKNKLISIGQKIINKVKQEYEN